MLLYLAAYFYISANKKKLIAQANEMISEKIDGVVTNTDADISFFSSFPKIAVRLSNTSITDSMYRVHQHPFFKAKEVFFSLNIFRLISGKPALRTLTIKDATIFLYTSAQGYTNKYLLRSKKDSAGGPKKTNKQISLESVMLQQTHFVLLDEHKDKLHDFMLNKVQLKLDDEGQQLQMQAKADMFINSLAFNLPRGTFLQKTSFAGNFLLTYGKETQVLKFAEIKLLLSGQPFVLTGSFDLGDKNPGFSLKIKADNVTYAEVKKLLPGRIDSSLSMVSLDKPLNATADLYGPLRGGEPYIVVRWEVKNANMKTNFMDFENASFNGYYKNEMVAGLPRKDPNSIISLRNFTASWHGLPVKAHLIDIADLQNPTLTCDLTSAFPLKSLNELIDARSLQLTAGNATVALTYKGPIERNNNTNSFLNGNIHFSNGNVLYTPRNVAMKDVNGDLEFNNSNVFLKDLRCNVLQNQVVMNGSAENVLTLINTEPNKVNVKYHIYSPSLNLASFTYLLAARKNTVAAKAPAKSLGNMASQLDELLEKSRIDIDLNADKILYNRFQGSKLAAAVTILQDRYVLNNVSMLLAGGSMKMNGQLLNNSVASHKANLVANLTNVDVKKLFYGFDNFGQQAIGYNNLQGQLTASTNIELLIDEAAKTVPNTTNGSINFSLKNAVLQKFEPIKKIQKFVFKNRDFDTIQFAELRNKLNIFNGDIVFNRMEIQSSVISIFTEGTYSQRGNTDISVQVPLSNLKKRDEDYIPENIGVDKSGGRSIFLRGRPGNDGDINFKLDLFKKYFKEHP